MKRFGLDFDTVTRAKGFSKPLRWKKPGRVFVNPWSDFFHEDADAWREEAWEIMRRTPHLTYILLTKRPENITGRLPLAYEAFGACWPLPNVWLGVTAENQEMADKRIPLLLSIPAAVRFVSVEPMIGEIKFNTYALTGRPCFVCKIEDELHEKRGTQSHPINCGWRKDIGQGDGGIDWVICGGESGVFARGMKPEWALSLKEQCAAAGVPFFMKQMSGRQPIPGYLQGQEFPVTV